MLEGIVFANLTIDCSNEKRLCEFYHRLLGWEKTSLFGHEALRNSEGFMLLFVQEKDFVPAVWPEEEGKQQKQIHFDFQVPDVAAAVEYAESIGGTKAQTQFGGDLFVTVLDPDGHPICLCAKE